MAKVEKGCVHGRFQPFHNGHLDYVLQAFDRAEFVSVGLTQIFKPRPSDSLEGRNSVASNPLTFQQRSDLVQAALIEAGVSRSAFDIIPFPIERSTQLREFVANGTVCFTTELNRWNAEKIRLLDREGFAVVRLRVSQIDDLRVATGTKIRALIRAGDASWEKLVPPAVFARIQSDYLPAFDTKSDDQLE